MEFHVGARSNRRPNVRLTGMLCRYDGTNFVTSSVNLGKPVIYVAVNYRYAIHVRI